MDARVSTHQLPIYSIIIPTFRAVHQLEDCIGSIQAQTCGDFEVWVVDGASQDGTVELLTRLGQVDPRIHWVSAPDRGVYDAMNKGITLARGEWLYFLGSDDRLYDPTVLADVRAATEGGSAEVVYGDVYSPRFGGTYDGVFDVNRIVSKNICHQAIFLRKSVFSKVGNFDLKYSLLADYEHNIRWFFSPEIEHQYLSRTIAHYADGGISSVQKDEVFGRDKIKHLLYRGQRRIPKDRQIHLITQFLNTQGVQLSTWKNIRWRLLRWLIHRMQMSPSLLIRSL